jgi:hypothetical protein
MGLFRLVHFQFRTNPGVVITSAQKNYCEFLITLKRSSCYIEENFLLQNSIPQNWDEEAEKTQSHLCWVLVQFAGITRAQVEVTGAKMDYAGAAPPPDFAKVAVGYELTCLRLIA